MEAEALRRYFLYRRELLRDCYTSSQVAALLGTSRQTPHDRLRARTLLAVQERGRYCFPKWQFDPAGPEGVVAGLPAVLRALDVPALSQVSWLRTPSPYLDGRTPLDALRQGETARVDAARAVGVS